MGLIVERNFYFAIRTLKYGLIAFAAKMLRGLMLSQKPMFVSLSLLTAIPTVYKVSG